VSAIRNLASCETNRHKYKYKSLREDVEKKTVGVALRNVSGDKQVYLVVGGTNLATDYRMSSFMLHSKCGECCRRRASLLQS
jgi:hypothetical protein